MTNSHPMKYRILWAWDSWVCDPFDAASYVGEFKKLIDFMAAWDYNGLIIWGFIDERHGGESAAKEVASYGKAKGVRILPGVGAGGYGGFVTSRNHPYNTDTFLAKHPDLEAIRRDPVSWQQSWICLYQEDTIKWLREGAAWLIENFDIGGVNIETNEGSTIDICEHAAQASQLEPNRLRYSASFWDLSIAVPAIHEEIKKRDPDSWITYATYQPPWWDRREDAWLLDRMPDDAIAQWNIEMNCNTDVPSPVRQNISLIHSGGWSYHLAAWPPIRTFTQRRSFVPNLDQARQFSANQRAMRTDGFVLGNVGATAMPDNEINYIAHSVFLANPEMTVDEFSARYVADIYGDKAEPYVKELMLNQPDLYWRLRGVQDAWCRHLLGQPVKEFCVADKADIEKLYEQIALVDTAVPLASESGRARLETIRQVLDEHRVIAELSNIPSLSRSARDWFGQRTWSIHGIW